LPYVKYAKMIYHGHDPRHELTEDNINSCFSLLEEKADWLENYLLLGHYYDMKDEVGSPIDINEWVRKINSLIRNPIALG
jgi:hypothetical protein